LQLPKNKAIEEYTYFYLDYGRQKLLVLKNDLAPSAPVHLKNHIWDKTNNVIEKITIIPTKISDIKKRLSLFSNIAEIECVFSSNPTKHSKFVPNVSGIHSKYENNIEKVNLGLKLKNPMPASKEFIDELSSLNESDGFPNRYFN